MVLCGTLKNCGNGNVINYAEIWSYANNDGKRNNSISYEQVPVLSHLISYMQDLTLKLIARIVSNFFKDNLTSKKCVHWNQHIY